MQALASIPPRGGSHPASYLAKAARPDARRAGRVFDAAANPASRGPKTSEESQP